MKPLNQPSFEIGQTVYLNIPESGCIGVISSFNMDPNGITYYVVWNDASGGTFFPCQLTDQRPPVVAES